MTSTLKGQEPIDIRYTRPWMYEKQQDALFNPARYCAVEAST